MTVSKICVGVDGSRPSIAALRFALEEAVAREAVVQVVTAWSSVPPYGGYGISISPEKREQHIRESNWLQSAAIEQAAQGLDTVPEIERTVVHSGRPTPWEALVELAASCGLLVVGTEHKGIFKRLVAGSTSDYCIRHSPVPVAVVPYADPALAEWVDATPADVEVALR